MPTTRMKTGGSSHSIEHLVRLTSFGYNHANQEKKEKNAHRIAGADTLH